MSEIIRNDAEASAPPEALYQAPYEATRATKGSAAYDVRADETVNVPKGERRAVSLGLALRLPEGVCCLLMGRSGLAMRGLDVHMGLIDPDYAGEIKAIIANNGTEDVEIKKGERIAQLVFTRFQDTLLTRRLTLPRPKLPECSHTGFGSTGTGVE